MATYIHDCPHCGANSSAFQSVMERPIEGKPTYFTLFMACPSCGRGLCLTVSDGLGSRPHHHESSLTVANKVGRTFKIEEVYPKRPADDIPADLPPRVDKAFRDGCAVLTVSPNAASGQFRRALELGLKDLAPEVEAWKLEKRIDKLAADHLLTPAIKDWAHQLRLDGNEAVHGEDDVTQAIATEIRELTRAVLTYLFTLPAQVDRAKSTRGE